MRDKWVQLMLDNILFTILIILILSIMEGIQKKTRLKIHKFGLLCVGGSAKLYSVQFSRFRCKLILDGNGSEWIEQGDAFDRIMDRDIDAAEGILTFIMISLSLDLSSSRIYHLFEHHQNDPKTF